MSPGHGASNSRFPASPTPFATAKSTRVSFPVPAIYNRRFQKQVEKERSL
jgi:hypothetical protein